MSARPPRVATATRHGNLVINVVEFCRLLQSFGIFLAADAAQIALIALREIDLTRRLDFRLTLQIALLKRPEDFELFNFLFHAYWRLDGKEGSAVSDTEPADGRDQGGADESATETSDAFEIARMFDAEVNSDGDVQLHSASPVGAGQFIVENRQADQRAELEQLARALASRLANRRARRLEVHSRGKKIDPRRMLRQSLRYGGVPVELHWRRPKRARTRLVIFCDVSRSMRDNTAFFLQFAYAALRRTWRVEVFLFASEIVRMTDAWRDQPWSEFMSHLPDCGGGTQIGACLAHFFDDYGFSLLDTKTFAIILSDGLDAGDPAMVVAAMEKLHKQCRAVFWLNPLLQHATYEPLARGMAAALPYIDVFAPAHDLASLRSFLAMTPKKSSSP